MENFLFYAYITSIYGLQTQRIFKDYAKCTKKLANKIPQRIFLLRCRKAKLIPAFIQNMCRNINDVFLENNPNRRKLHRTVNNFQLKTLNLVISDKNDSIHHLESKLIKLQNKISEFSDPYIDQFITRQKSFKHTSIERLKTINVNKFNALKRRTFESLNFDTQLNQDWFVNLSNVAIPDEICWLLSLGHKFSLPIEQKDFPMFRFIADAENALAYGNDDESKEVKRSKIANILNKARYTNDVNDPVHAEIVRIHKLAKTFLKHNRNIVIVSADKGNRTVVMLKTDYESKMLDLLNDTSTYRKLNFDTSELLQARAIHMATRFKNNKWITQEEFNSIIMYNAAIPKAYGQPKVHKPGNPLRIIIASYESPAYNASIFLKNILQNLTKNSKFNTINAMDFKDRVKNLKLSNDEVMLSLDVKSLFTNVPLDLLETILEEKWSDIEKHTKLPKAEFFQLLNFVIRDCNQFIYDNTIYKQTEGVPMGLPLSPILADIVMEYILDQAASRVNGNLKELVKYVDDLFLIVPSGMFDHVLDTFNSIHPKIQFTSELEHNGQLPFLDVILTHNSDGTIDYAWYAKPTASNRQLNYFSNHPLTHKLNVVDNIIRRMYGLSSKKFHDKCTLNIKQILCQNNYPIKLINERIKKYFCTRNSRQTQMATNTSLNINNVIQFRGIQFNSTCSQNIGNVLCKNVPDLRMGYKPIMTNRTLFSKTKQKTTKENMYGVVYDLPCYGDGRGSACDLEYVGNTGHKLGTRNGQHENDIKNFNETGKLEGQTAVVHHFYDTGHVPDFCESKILEVERNFTKRRILESLHILTKPTINFRRDTENISTSYNCLLNRNLESSQC